MKDSNPPAWARWTEAAAMALTIAAMVFIPGITPDSDPTGYLPSDCPEVAFWREMTRKFQGFDTVMVGLEEPGPRMSADGLARLARITDLLSERKADGILFVRSVTNVETLREEEGTLNAEMMIPVIPRTAEDLEALGQRILADVQVPGALVSRDLQAYMVLVQMDPRKDPAAIAALVMDLVEAERGPMQAVYYGAPFVSNWVSRQVLRSLPWVVPLFAAVLFLVLWATLRRPWMGLMVLGLSAMPLLWWLGLLRVLGMPVTMTVLNGALLLVVMAALVYGRMMERRLTGATRLPWRDLWMPLGLAALGVAVLAVTNRAAPRSLPYLARFGESLLVGIGAVGLFGVMAVWPALIRVSRREESPRLLRWPVLGRMALLAVLLGLAGLSAFGARGVRFAVGLRDLFRPGDEVGKSLAFFDRHFGGADLLQVSVRGDIGDPAVMGRLGRLTDLLEGSGAFGDVRSVSQVVSFVAKGMTGVASIPKTREGLGNLWFFLEGSRDLRSLVTDSRDEAMLALRIPRDGLPLERRLEVARKAIDQSAEVGPEGARRRLEALARVFGVTLPQGRTEATLRALAAGRDPDLEQEVRRQLLELWKGYLFSGEAPFTPSEEEWPAIAATLDRPDRREALAAVLSGLASRPPEVEDPMIRDLAETLDVRVRDQGVVREAEGWTDRWLAGLGEVPVPLRIRASGVFGDLLQGEGRPEREPEFTLSGFPVLEPAVEARLLEGLWRAVAALWAPFALWVLGTGIHRPRRWFALLSSAFGVLLTMAAAAWTGIQVDSNSATMFLLPGLLPPFLSGDLWERGGTARRWPAAFAFSLAGAGATLAALGVMPVTRLGLAMTFGLLASLLGASFCRRLIGETPS